MVNLIGAFFPPQYYLIVEVATLSATAAGRSQFWLIDSKDIIDIPVVSPETVYTGKQLKFRHSGDKISGTCVLFSADFSFVQTQFSQISMEPQQQQHPSHNQPLVLNVSNKGNILESSGGAAKRIVKLSGGGVTVKPVAHKMRETGTNMIEVLEMPHLDSENIPPNKQHNSLTIQPVRVMTFDQQSQTENTMYDSVLPATAPQMHQQSQQIAQLIRANNGLVMEIKDLKEMVVGITNKLNETLSMIQAGVVVQTKEEIPDSVSFTEISSNHGGSVQNISVYETTATDLSMDRFPNSFTAPQSREQSLARSTTSENTPPLKKNKVKLKNSMRMSSESQHNTSEDYVTIGDNGTMVSKRVIDELRFDQYSTVVRKILANVFDRETLASHSLTGKPSPGKEEITCDLFGN